MASSASLSVLSVTVAPAASRSEGSSPSVVAPLPDARPPILDVLTLPHDGAASSGRPSPVSRHREQMPQTTRLSLLKGLCDRMCHVPSPYIKMRTLCAMPVAVCCLSCLQDSKNLAKNDFSRVTKICGLCALIPYIALCTWTGGLCKDVYLYSKENREGWNAFYNSATCCCPEEWCPVRKERASRTQLSVSVQPPSRQTMH